MVNVWVDPRYRRLPISDEYCFHFETYCLLKFMSQELWGNNIGRGEKGSEKSTKNPIVLVLPTKENWDMSW